MLNSDLEQTRCESNILPWDDLEAGVRRGTLWKSFKKAKFDLEKPTVEIFHPGATRRSIPTTWVSTKTVGFWIRIAESDAHHPGSTVARRFLRELFVSNPDVAKAYGGNPKIQHPSGTSGLALLTAQFGGSVNLPTAIEIQPAFDELVFLVELDTGSIRTILDQLKTEKVPFQTGRRGNDLWSVIKKGYRNRTGLLALCERSAASGLVLCGAQVKHMAGFDAHVTAIFEKNGASLCLLRSIGESQNPEFLSHLLL
jgi:hypothetical protein